jgi:glutathione S-transferase
MRLFLSANSPYARKVHVALLEKGVPFEPVFVAASDPAVAAANPLGKIPALVGADGTPVYDSPVILQYLEVVAPTPALYPTDPSARIAALRWEALGDGVCDAVVARLLESRRPAERQDPSGMAHQAGKIARGLEAIARGLGEREYAVGDAFTVADIAIATTLGYTGLRAPELLAPFGELRARYAAMLARPSLAATVPPG